MPPKSVDKPNIAYVLISTHGAIHGLEEEVVHDIPLNVYKINATAVGVCNMVEDGELSLIGENMKSFISKNDRLSPDDMVRELREELPLIDKIHKEAFAIRNKQTKNRNKRKSDVFMHTRTYKQRKVDPYEGNSIIEKSDIDEDPDVYGQYVNHSDKAYSSVKWEMGDSYRNKHYTLIRSERSETNANMYNNTVMLLNNKDGFVDLDLVGIHHNTRSQAKEEDVEEEEEDARDKYNNEFTMKDILEELHQKGYTDVVIIDLSCAAGEDDRDERKIRRTLKLDTKRGGKQKTRKTRKTRKKRKTKTKRKTKLKRK